MALAVCIVVVLVEVPAAGWGAAAYLYNSLATPPVLVNQCIGCRFWSIRYNFMETSQGIVAVLPYIQLTRPPVILYPIDLAMEFWIEHNKVHRCLNNLPKTNLLG